MTSRRKFLKQGTLGAVAAGFSLGLADQAGTRASALLPSASADLNRAAFESQLQTTFLIYRRAGRVPLKLIEVVNYGSRTSFRGVREAFALVFRGSNEQPLEQETYTIEHEKLGRLSFLMVPIISRDKSSRYYEININRLHG